MEPQTTSLKESTFVLRRMAETLPLPALLFPLLFAFGVLICIALYRRKYRLQVFGVGAAILLALGVLGLVVCYGEDVRKTLSWWLVLIPTLVVAFVYIVLMYIRDSHTIHAAWATFLGLLRMLVYCLLGVCFLLPGCQEYDTTITESK